MPSHTPKGQLARERALAAAERLFSELGFHGVGLREIAAAADMPVAGLQYHFGRKEKLYAEVLAAIAKEVSSELAIEESAGLAYPERFDRLVRGLGRWALEKPMRTRLLLRELLDNPLRVAKADALPYADVLRGMSAVFADGHRLGVLAPASPEIAVLHLVGAVSYYVAARPTFRRIVGVAAAEAAHAAYLDDFVRFAGRALGLEEETHGSRHADRTRAAGARARRASNDRHR